MTEEIISSKTTPLLTGGKLLLIFVVLWFVIREFLPKELSFLSILVWGLMFIKKKKEIDVGQRTFKDGPLNRAKELSSSGYISVVRKINKTTKKLDKEGLQLMYVVDNKPTRIYSDEDYDELKETAIYLGNKWDCGVFEVHSKTWLLDKL